MQIKLFVSAAAIALVAGLASASAAGQFSTLEGIAAVALTQPEMGKVTGGFDTVGALNVVLPGLKPDESAPGRGPNGMGGVGAVFHGGGPLNNGVATGNDCLCAPGPGVADFK